MENFFAGILFVMAGLFNFALFPRMMRASWQKHGFNPPQGEATIILLRLGGIIMAITGGLMLAGKLEFKF